VPQPTAPPRPPGNYISIHNIDQKNNREGDYVGDIDIGWKIILKCTFLKFGGELQVGLN
jgi:hypothetical protein